MVALKGYWDTLESCISSRLLMGLSIRETAEPHALYILLWEHGEPLMLCDMFNRYYRIAKVTNRMCCMQVIAGARYGVNVCCCTYIFGVVSTLIGLLRLLGLEGDQR